MSEVKPLPPIAIVGMAVEFPGAQDSHQLWDLLVNGLNTVSEIPKGRFNMCRASAASTPSGKPMNGVYGNFLHQPDAFDNAFFRISPREARSMDPQQRLLLRTAYNALENAGYVPNTPTFSPDTIGTFIGAATNDYVVNLRNDIDVYYSTGTLQSFLSGKIAYAFGFGGPSIVIDTACSSSLVAIHQACRALQAGDCTAALAGGVNVITSPDMYVGLARGHFLSKTGQCRPWDSSADGYCRSEGCGMFVLKRLEDAVAENDRILAVIKGSEVNQSGNARSITHPHVPSQIALYEKLLVKSGVQPHSISVAECHGTGTQAGDPAELEAIRAVFARGRTEDDPLHITSIKASIGHAEAASGAASLAKLVLMMRHDTIPRHVSFTSLNPRIPPLSTDNIHIDTSNSPWKGRGDGKRTALLTNFGASGSNAALILEEYTPCDKLARYSEHVVAMSCKTPEAAEKHRIALLAQLEQIGDDRARLRDFAYTSTVRRQLHSFRIAASGSSSSTLLQNLRTAPIVHISPTLTTASEAIFVFSGQGAQYLGMGAPVGVRIPCIQDFVDECERKLRSWGFQGVYGTLTGLSFPYCEVIREFQQPEVALFVLEYALALMWQSWGIKPCAVIGHSFGEFAALVVAGVLSLDDALWLVATRTRLISKKVVSDQTSMVSIRSSVEQVEELLKSFPKVTICCHNSFQHFTVGGDRQALQKLTKVCTERGIQCTPLNIPYAFHSSAMSPIVSDLLTASRDVQFKPPTIPVLSGVSGTMVPAGDKSVFTIDYFARHACEPLHFHEAILQLQSNIEWPTIGAIIELGPHTTTLPLLRDLQRFSPGSNADASLSPLLLPSMRKNEKAFEVICASLTKLYCTSVSVDWRAVFADLAPGAKLTDLPAYPFADTRFWVPYKERSAKHETPNDRSYITAHAPEIETTATKEVDIATLAPLIQGHSVLGTPLCPASVYTELILSTALPPLQRRQGWTSMTVLSLADLDFSSPLVYTPSQAITVRVDVRPSDPGLARGDSFRVVSFQAGNMETQSRTHCSGTVKTSPAARRGEKFRFALPTTIREVQRILQSQDDDTSSGRMETFSGRTVYDLLFPQIVSYSQEYRAIESITVNPASSSAWATVRRPSAQFASSSIEPLMDQIFVDTLTHVAGFLVNFTFGMNGRDAFVCTGISSLSVVQVDWSASLGMFASVVWKEETEVTVDVHAVVVNPSSGLPQEVVARLKRARFRKVSVSSLKRGLAAASTAQALDPISQTGLDPKSFPTQDLQADVLAIIAKISGLSKASVVLDAPLAPLGINSLMVWELVARLRNLTPGRALDTAAFANAKTISDIVHVVENASPEKAEGAMSTADSAVTLCDLCEGNGIGSMSSTEKVLQKKAEATAFHEPITLNTVKNIISSILDIPTSEFGSDADLETLGLDSLASIELRYSLKTKLGIHLAENNLLTCRTVNDIHRMLLSSRDAFSPDSQSTASLEDAETPVGPELVRLQHGPPHTRAPLQFVLIHDGSGLVSSYKRLAPLGCDVWAIQNTRFSVSAGTDRVLVAMAASYVRILKDSLSKEGTENIIIGGWSFGGVVAYEIARQLLEGGLPIKGLVLIDAPAPQTNTSLPDAFIEAVADSTPNPGSRSILSAQMRAATRALCEYNTYGTSGIGPIKVIILRARDSADLAAAYRELDHDTTRFFERPRSGLEDDATIRAWKDILSDSIINIAEVPGDHFTVFSEQHIGALSKSFKAALSQF